MPASALFKDAFIFSRHNGAPQIHICLTVDKLYPKNLPVSSLVRILFICFFRADTRVRPYQYV